MNQFIVNDIIGGGLDFVGDVVSDEWSPRKKALVLFVLLVVGIIITVGVVMFLRGRK